MKDASGGGGSSFSSSSLFCSFSASRRSLDSHPLQSEDEDEDRQERESRRTREIEGTSSASPSVPTPSPAGVGVAATSFSPSSSSRPSSLNSSPAMNEEIHPRHSNNHHLNHNSSRRSEEEEEDDQEEESRGRTAAIATTTTRPLGMTARGGRKSSHVGQSGTSGEKIRSTHHRESFFTSSNFSFSSFSDLLGKGRGVLVKHLSFLTGKRRRRRDDDEDEDEDDGEEDEEEEEGQGHQGDRRRTLSFLRRDRSTRGTSHPQPPSRQGGGE